MHAGPASREPSPRIGARKIDGDDRIAEPAEPFEEIVRMPRPAPQSGVANRRAGGRGPAKRPQLPVGERLAGDGDDKDEHGDEVLQPQIRRRVTGGEEDRECQRDAHQRLLLRQEPHLPRRVLRAPGPAQRRIARVIDNAGGTRGDMQAKAHRPGEHGNRHQPAPRRARGRRGGERHERAEKADDAEPEGPHRVDPAGIAGRLLGDPAERHGERKARGNGDERQHELHHRHGAGTSAATDALPRASGRIRRANASRSANGERNDPRIGTKAAMIVRWPRCG